MRGASSGLAVCCAWGLAPGNWENCVCHPDERGKFHAKKKKKSKKEKGQNKKKKKEKEKKKKGNIIEAWSVVCVREKKGAHEYFIVLVNSRDAKHVLYQIVLHMYIQRYVVLPKLIADRRRGFSTALTDSIKVIQKKVACGMNFPSNPHCRNLGSMEIGG